MVDIYTFPFCNNNNNFIYSSTYTLFTKCSNSSQIIILYYVVRNYLRIKIYSNITYTMSLKQSTLDTYKNIINNLEKLGFVLDTGGINN